MVRPDRNAVDLKSANLLRRPSRRDGAAMPFRNLAGRTALRAGLFSAVCLALAGPVAAERIFVSNEKDNTIAVLDGKTLSLVKTVAVGARPRGIVLSNDGNALYICASDADHIEVL